MLDSETNFKAVPEGFYSRIATDTFGKLEGVVYCHVCSTDKPVNYAVCFELGWPRCCSETMSTEPRTGS